MAKTLQQTNLKVSSQFLEFIAANNRAVVAHLYKFTSAAGATDYFTDLDIDINYANQIWKSGSLRIEGMTRKLAVGLQVDEQNVKIWAGPEDTLFGGLFLPGMQQGVMDGGILTRYRAVWNLVTGNAAYDISNNSPIAVWCLYTGYTSKIGKGGLSHVEVTFKSPLVKLETNMPRNYYQPGCLWTLFDFGCTLDKNAFAVNGVLTSGAGPTDLILPISGGITGLGADGIAEYAQGRVLFITGVNAGLQTLIQNNDTVNLYLAYPLIAVPSVGDQVIFTPGCSKAFTTCDTKYNNKANFRGYDKVPPVMLSV